MVCGNSKVRSGGWKCFDPIRMTAGGFFLVMGAAIGGDRHVGDGRTAGNDTMDRGKRRLWLRMATETPIYRSHVPI
jgi:hypothetical protein